MRMRTLMMAALCLPPLGCDDAPSDSPVADVAVTLDGGRDDASRPDAEAPPDAAMDAGCDCPGQQRCVAGGCEEPEVCAGAEDCLDERRCVEGACHDRCLDDEACGQDLRCDVATQICVVDDRCRVDADCGPDRICEGAACLPRCAEGGCPGGQVCDAMSGRCVEAPEGCAEDVDCVDGRICREGDCVQACAEDAACAGAQACVEGRCVEPAVCSSDTDCLVDRRCVAGACADPCPRVPCPDALICDEGSGRCGEARPCAEDDGCFPGRRCEEGACEDPCGEDADCPGGQPCLEGRCVEPEICRDPLDCQPGRVCQRGACVPRCDAVPCEGDLRCDGPTGLCLEADPCRGDDGCFEGSVCADGVCTPPCVEDAQCPGAMRCVDGACAEPALCLGDADCAGDRRCVETRCLAPCVEDRCPGVRACEAGACVEGPACAEAADCDAGRTCHPDLRVCVDRCPDERCPVDQICGDDGLCEEAPGCFDDLQCLGARGCRLNLCRAVDCESHGDCPDRCVDWRCTPAIEPDCPDGWRAEDGHCEQPGPCAPGVCPRGTVCAASGLCVDCGEDADCPGGARCDGGRCVDPDLCVDDAACLPGHVCLGGTCVPGECEDDALSPNHDPGSAIDLPFVDVPGLRACEVRPDWYRVGGPEGVRITARFPRERPPLELALFPAGGAEAGPVDLSRATPGEAWVDGGPGQYLLRVTAIGGGEGDYTLRIDPVGCDADPFERPWRNDDRARATPVGAGRLAGTLCPDDVDWFRYTGPGRARITAEGEVMATVDDRPAPQDVEPGALIRVGGAGAYTLEIAPDARPAVRCADAPEAPLGAPFPAEALEGPDSFAPACLAASGPDQVFRLEVPRRGLLSASLLDPQPGAALLLYSDCEAAPLTCSDFVGTLNTPVAAGRYYLVVEGPYAGRVQVDLADEGPAACADPPLLPPGRPLAVRPAPGAPDFAGACLAPAADAVVYQFSLAEASQVQLAYDGGGDDSRMSLRRLCADGQSEIACDASAAPRADELLEAGLYFVVLQGGAAGSVQLEVQADEAPLFLDDMCLPAGGVPQLAPGFATRLAGDTADAFDAFDATACGAAAGGADRVLQFEVREPVRLRATAASMAFSPVVSLIGDDCFGAPICAEPAAALDVPLAPGVWALVIDGDGPGGGAFDLDLEVRAP